MHGMGHNTTDDCGGMGMIMSFHWGHCETLLFDEWKVFNAASLAVACILTFLLSVLIEALLIYEIRLGPKKLALQTGLHVTNNILSYGVMLIVMSYQAGLFLAAVLGRMVGYFLFAWLRPPRMVISVDCCQ